METADVERRQAAKVFEEALSKSPVTYKDGPFSFQRVLVLEEHEDRVCVRSDVWSKTVVFFWREGAWRREFDFGTVLEGYEPAGPSDILE